MRIEFAFTPEVRKRMEAGLSFLYTTCDGHRWYIDATLSMPYRQVDFAEAMYDAFSLDGLGFFPSYPSLSVCQFALEEGCPDWHGEGWYWLYAEGESEHAEWIDSIEELKDRVAALEKGWKNEHRAFFANYAGNGSDLVTIY